MFDDSYRFNVLFLCATNSARSIFGEAILNQRFSDRVKAYSAGSHPVAAVDPLTFEVLAEKGLTATGLRAKSWQEFSGMQTPQMDFIFTVCDTPRNEICPIWPGSPMTAHWGVADPSAVTDGPAARLAAFRDAYDVMDWRINRLLELRFSTLTRLSLLSELQAIGGSMRPYSVVR